MDQPRPGDDWLWADRPRSDADDQQFTVTNEPSRVVQFISFQPLNDDRPRGREGSSNRSAIQSHAARAVHARRRRARTLAFQAVSGSQGGSSGPPSSRDEENVALILARRTTAAYPRAVVGNQERSDPFASFARPFSPTEHALLDHYLAHIIPLMKMSCGRLQSLDSAQRETLTVGWVQLALSNLDFLNGLFLNASRSLSVAYQEPPQKQQYSNLAVQYKLLCVKFVIDAINSTTEPRRLGDIIVAETLVLAFDERLIGDAAMTKRHVEGAARIVELKGGPQTLGMNGFLAMLFAKYLEDVGLTAGAVSGDT